jgi:hypothetical protein
MNVQLADVMVHIDQNLSPEQRSLIEMTLRAMDGVVSVRNPDDRPHLSVIEYVPEKTSSQAILSAVTGRGVHAELIGL